MVPFRRVKPEPPRRRLSQSEQPITPPQFFQRNRTLTGTTSDAVTTTHPGTQLQSPRTRAHQLAQLRRRIVGILLLVGACALLLTWLLSQLTAQVMVTSADTQLSQPLDMKRYTAAIQSYLAANPAERLRFALNTDHLTSYLQKTVPEVEAVTVQAGSHFGESDFDLSLRRPVAGWQINSNQYYVDGSGVAFQRNYFAAPSLQIVDNSSVATEQGSAVTSSRFLSFVGQIVTAAKGEGFTVTQAVLPIGTTRELEIHLSGAGEVVRLSIDRPAGEQAEDMARAVRYLTSKHISASYVDVRVSGKAFYQ